MREGNTVFTQLSDLIVIETSGQEPATAIKMTTRKIDRAAGDARAMTPDRKRIADHLLCSEPLRSYLIAHKTIGEWLDQDERRHKPPLRLETLAYLESQIRALGKRPGPPGKRGNWFTSSPPSAEAPSIERTITQALEAFAKMVGPKTIYVFGREN